MTIDRVERSSFVHRYPIASFYLLAFTLGAGIIFMVVLGVIPAELSLTAGISASIAGLVITAVVDGRAGLKLMFSRLLIWRAGIGYWLFALLYLLPAFLLGSLFNPLFNGDPLSFEGLQPVSEILIVFITFFIVAGLGQELGWSGFLIPRLQAHYSALTSSLLRTILVAIWHLPLLLYSRSRLEALANFPYSSWITQKGFLVAFLVMVLLFSFPWSVLYTWIFNNTKGSILLVAVLHGSEIWLAYGMLSAGIDANNLDNYWGYGAVLALTAVVIIIATGARNLSRRYTRVIYQPTDSAPMD